MNFLGKLQKSSKKILLVTNAHRNSLGLKMEKTCLQPFFDDIISSHDVGFAKEHPEFWRLLHQQHRFDKASTLLVDDSLAVLNAARAFGIGQIIAVSKPDTQQAKRNISDFLAIEDFRELMVGL
jgi:putative hydrolase of the HAD superfamily